MLSFIYSLEKYWKGITICQYYWINFFEYFQVSHSFEWILIFLLIFAFCEYETYVFQSIYGELILSNDLLIAYHQHKLNIATKRMIYAIDSTLVQLYSLFHVCMCVWTCVLAQNQEHLYYVCRCGCVLKLISSYFIWVCIYLYAC